MQLNGPPALEHIRLLRPSVRLSAIGELFAGHGPEVITRMAPLAPLNSPYIATVANWDEVEDAFHKIILGLGSFDIAFTQATGYSGHIYIVCPPGVARLLDKLGLGIREPLYLETLLQALATIGLLFAFDLASKYDYGQRGMLQVRLNGWGRIVLTELDGTELHTCVEKCLSLMGSHMKQYTRLLDLLAGIEQGRPTEIDSLNRSVPIPIAG